MEFDSKTDRAGMSAATTNCAAILSPDSLPFVDGIASAKCVWQSHTTLVTTLNPELQTHAEQNDMIHKILYPKPETLNPEHLNANSELQTLTPQSQATHTQDHNPRK